MEAYNVLIIGSGPAGLFAAMQLEHQGLDRIAIIDRHPYPAGGLLNDGKLNFDYRIGIDLDELKIDVNSAKLLMEEIRQVFIHQNFRRINIYLKFIHVDSNSIVKIQFAVD